MTRFDQFIWAYCQTLHMIVFHCEKVLHVCIFGAVFISG